MNKRPAHLLPIIIFSQFAGTSLWFATNAILPELQQLWHLKETALGFVTSAVQAGFILGTLTFAVLVISDRFSPRFVFLWCSIFGALANLSIYLFSAGFWSLILCRFLTGVFLAGIYPVGMKIAASWYKDGLGKALGYLVGALVLGTAFPHFMKSIGQSISWEIVIFIVSGIALSGGISLFLLVPDGPHLPGKTKFNPKAIGLIFRSRGLRSAAFGYFGHMWELYAVWAFVPVFLLAYNTQHLGLHLNISRWSFYIIAAGSIGCVVGGEISPKVGSAHVASTQLVISGFCCLLSPFLFRLPWQVSLFVLLLWGVCIAGDSPQYSALTAQYAPRELVGSALTIVTCIGFSITVISIQLMNTVQMLFSSHYLFLPLAIGPLLGLLAMRPLLRAKNAVRRDKVRTLTN